ncbi:MAG: ATP-dependent zinc metalloprotease FtsH, partial [Myxococcales bacterium]
MALTPQKRPALPPRIGKPAPPGNGAGPPADGSGFRMPPRKAWLWFLAMLLVNFAVLRFLKPGAEPSITVPYTFFKDEVKKGNVESIYARGDTLTGRFKAAVTYPPAGEAAAPNAAKEPPKSAKSFASTLPSFVDPGLEEFLIENHVEISARPIEEERSPIATLIYGFGPALLLIGLYVWMFRRAAKQGGGISGLMGIGQSKARRYDQMTDQKVTFDDVAGIDEAENELVEIVDFLRDPAKYTRLGGTAPKGVLLIGAPGTGKTLLARAVAGEANVPFFSMSAAEFVEMIVGVGAARVRDLFKQAREHAPAIVFIDEMDAIGRARGQMSIGGSSEQEQTLNQILTEMDGFSSREGIIVLAATNQPDVLDKALLRPGRFDRRVVVNLPDKTGREAILKVHTRQVPLSTDVILESLAGATPGFSGADLKNLVNEAALLAARRDHSEVSAADFGDALEKILLGAERKIMLNPSDRERTAYHEAGHAVVGMVTPGADPVRKVSIIPRGVALGVTFSAPEADRFSYDENYLRGRIRVALGGRAADELVWGERTTGAEADIRQLTEIARRMVGRWGMSEAIGPVAVLPSEPNGPLLPGASETSETTQELVDTEVRRLVDGAHEEASELLRQNRDKLDSLAQALLETETLDEVEANAAAGMTPPPRRE